MSIDTLSFPVISGLISHLFFNQFEPRSPLIWILFLLGVPALEALCLITVYSAPLLSNFALCIAIHNLCLAMSTVIYRISPFHSLAKLPGPFMARVSTLYTAKMAASGKRHLQITSLHEQYGEFVRIGPNAISVVNVDIAKDCLGSQGLLRTEQYLWSKIAPLNLVSSNSVANGAINPYEDHTRRRRIWNQAFTGVALKEYDVYISNRVSLLVDRLSEQPGSVDLGKWISYFTFDLMGDIVFGGGFEMLADGGDRHRFWEIVLQSMSHINVATSNGWIGHLVPYFSVGKDGEHIMSFTEDCVRMRMRRESFRKDLYYYLTENEKLDAPSISFKQLTDEMFLGVLGGADTTSSVMSNAFYSLISNHTVLEKLKNEIDEEFGDEDPSVSPSRLAKMPYLNAVVKETLRLYPAVPANMSRTPVPGSGGRTLVAANGFVIPEGTNVYFPVRALLRDPRYFSPEPNKFWPERWLLSSSEVTLNHEAFLPFSYGPANCVGKHLANREMRAVIAGIVDKFGMRFAAGYDPAEWLDTLRDDHVFLKGRLPVVFTRRR